MNPTIETAITEELAEVSRKLEVPISVTYEGQKINL
jgi:hypothetical protein